MIFTARVRSTREGNVLTSVCPSIHPSVCPQGGVPISHNALQHFPECHEAARGVPGPPPGGGGTRVRYPRGYPDPPGGTRVRYPPGGTRTPRGGTRVRYPPWGVPRPPRGYPGQVPPPQGGTQTPPGGYLGQVPPPGGYPDPPGGYPGQVPPPRGGVPGPRGVPGSGTPPGGVPGPPRGVPRSGTTPLGGYPGRTTEGVLTTRRAVCLLRSRRRTFLFYRYIQQKNNLIPEKIKIFVCVLIFIYPSDLTLKYFGSWYRIIKYWFTVMWYYGWLSRINFFSLCKNPCNRNGIHHIVCFRP